jgi:predicted ABC-type ATPase
MPPALYIIARPNGAGKTTASFSTLPTVLGCDIFINADEIARGLSPFNPDVAAFRAGRLMLELINENMNDRNTFAIETTLSTKSYKSYIERAKSLGYRIVMIFIYLESTDLAIQRVKRRVEEGGHNIPKHVIIRRYDRGLENLKNFYASIIDRLLVINNTENNQEIIIDINEHGKFIKDRRTYDKIFK